MKIADDRRMRWLVLAALVGCEFRTPNPIDAPGTPEQCEAVFDAAVDRSCGSAGDCTLVTHPDCCGDVIIGVSQSGYTTALSAETRYDRCESTTCGARGCQHAPESEDHMVLGANQMFVPVCLAGRCSSTVQ